MMVWKNFNMLNILLKRHQINNPRQQLL
jgi:hypothetical protein